jgi:endonuclease G
MLTRSALALLLLLAAVPALGADHLAYGQPDCSGPVLDKKYFLVCYDPSAKIPAWVGYALTQEDARSTAVVRKGSFRADPELPKGQRAENADYVGTPYDKGHMAPADDFRRGADAMRSTFVLTNAVPQAYGLNRGKWSKLEEAVQRMAASGGTVWVFSGPVFAGGNPVKRIGPGKVAVPTHTYKVVLYAAPAGALQMFGFVLPNIQAPKGRIADYTVSVSQVEKLAGIQFFSALPGQQRRRLEREVNLLPAE